MTCGWSSRLVVGSLLSVQTLSVSRGMVLADESYPVPPRTPGAAVVAIDDDSDVDVELDASEVSEAAEGVAPAPSSEAQKPAPRPAAPPKKKTPPQFPGPKVLPPTGPFKPLFFDNDPRFPNPADCPDDWCADGSGAAFELGDVDFLLSSGGELRHRWMSQDNRLQPGGPGKTDYQLWRWRHYLDLKAGDRVRLYVEGIDASSFGEDLPEQPIDVNRWDLLNAFIDVKVFDTGTGTQTLRYGRQELLFGRQRLVSPLDWANTRRNFSGFRYLVREPDWKLDVFAVNPVNSATGYRSVTEFDNRFDRPNRDVWFSGAYWSYTAIENTNIDLYWLWLDNSDPTPGRADGRRHTIGGRYSELAPQADGRVWDFDVEAAYQCGDDLGERVNAGFATAILGHTWKKAHWSPRLSGLAYFGTGDVDRSDGQTNTFDVLFPLGHAYWAISDNLSGQNLLDLAAQVDVRPTDKSALVAAWHHFQLASDDDVVYNVAGAPIGTPGNGTDVGNALDLYGYYAFNPCFDVQLGASWFWYGEFIDRTTPRGDATQFYVQTSLRY
ncbi:MAG: alginate export family protein [Planctomyces sp.]|nr:alginate export family protein [Planctomyces sp.]